MPRSGPGPVMGRPRSRAWPVVAGKRPATMFRIVLLPQPEGPRKTRNSPTPGSSWTVRLTSRMASQVLPSGRTNVLETFLSSRTLPLSSCPAIARYALPAEPLTVLHTADPVHYYTDDVAQ